jgi:putative endonuclease
VRLLALLSDALRHRAERRSMTSERALGRRGEDHAHRFLEKRGFRVVARNYRAPAGGNEIDLVAWDKEHLVFVEVKTRTADDVSTPDRAVTPEKQRRLVHAARDYSRRANVDWGCVRFDVVAVVDGPKAVIQHYPDAFGIHPNAFDKRA